MRLNRYLVPFLLPLVLLSSCRKTPPNVVLILADDLGYGELGCYGQKLIETPNLDGLASRGMQFTQHYSGSPVCAPARCVLLTGLHTGHAQIRGNDEWRERGDVWDYAKAVEDPGLEGQRPLLPETVTVGRLLQGAGYKTAIVGKWGLGAPTTQGIPNLQGFDFFFGYNCQRQAHTYYPKHLWRNTEKVWLANQLVVPGTLLEPGADPLAEESYRAYTQTQYAPDLLLEEALAFLEENRDQPYFLYFASPIPHVPLQAPQRWLDHYIRKFGDEEPYLGQLSYFPHRHPRAAYAAMVSYLDEQVGAIIRKLEETGVRDRTLVLFTSDNGPTFNGGSDSAFFDSARPFRSDRGWGKASLREGGIRVPFLAEWPAKIPPGSRADTVSAFWDILPTLCDVAGVPIPEGLDGVSLLPTLLNRSQQEQHRFLYWEYPSSGGQQAVRIGDWKGLRQGILDGRLEISLFDLALDPLEEVDVSDSNPEIVNQVRRIMEEARVAPEIEVFRMRHLGDLPPAEAEEPSLE